jgi:hypothetical protein
MVAQPVSSGTNVVPESYFSAGAPDRGNRPLHSVDDVVGRAQRLIDSPQPYDGYPLDWHFEALNVGDLTAIASVALRASSSSSALDTP